MPIFDPFRFSFGFLGLLKSALIAVLKTSSGASLLILVYDAVASFNLVSAPVCQISCYQRCWVGTEALNFTISSKLWYSVELSLLES